MILRPAIDTAADLAAEVTGLDAESIVVVVAPIDDPLDLALVRASIGPLAVRMAPAMRLNAVLTGPAADPADVAAAAAFLDGAVSTTGQIVDIR